MDGMGGCGGDEGARRSPGAKKGGDVRELGGVSHRGEETREGVGGRDAGSLGPLDSRPRSGLDTYGTWEEGLGGEALLMDSALQTQDAGTLGP